MRRNCTSRELKDWQHLPAPLQNNFVIRFIHLAFVSDDLAFVSNDCVDAGVLMGTTRAHTRLETLSYGNQQACVTHVPEGVWVVSYIDTFTKIGPMLGMNVGLLSFRVTEKTVSADTLQVLVNGK